MAFTRQLIIPVLEEKFNIREGGNRRILRELYS